MTRKAFQKRRGAVIALFAILLPVLLLLCGVAINIAYMQLTHTEMQVAVDAAARAGGRAFSEFQDVDQAKQMAFDTAPLNDVAGAPLQIDQSDGGAVVTSKPICIQWWAYSRIYIGVVMLKRVGSDAEVRWYY